jgi:nucleotide-binding universal stress UspA family protein/CBS domain-containing protein
MTTGVVAVRAGTPYREMVAMFRKHRVSGFPVVDDDGKVIGVVSETDLLAVEAAEPDPGAHTAPRGWRPHRKVLTVDEATAGALMTHPAVTVGPGEMVRNAARLMLSLKLQRLPVVDRDGRLAGIISRSDVLSVFRRTDEEIRREITQDVIADGFFTDPARFMVAVHDGIVTLEGVPGSAVLGASIVDQVRHLEGVVAVRDRFTYPDSGRSSLRSVRDLGPGINSRNAPCRPARRTIMMAVGERRAQDSSPRIQVRQGGRAMASKPIVAAADGSEESLRAVDWAAREAVLRGAPLRIVSAAAILPRMMSRVDVTEKYEDVTDVLIEDRDRALAAAAARAAQTAPGLLIDTDQLTGAPAQAVTESGSGALMLVVGSRGRGAFTALVLGSVSRYAASHASCPVVVVRDETASTHRQVVIGIGDLDHSADSLTFAFEEAGLRQASLMAVHAWRTPQGDISRAGESFTAPGPHAVETEAARQLEGLLDKWRAKYPDVPVSQDVVHGHAGRALVGQSARADLVVLGRHATHPDRPGPGSVRHAVLNHAHGPVAVVPSSSSSS